MKKGFRILKFKKDKPIFEIKDLSKSFSGRPILKKISMKVFPGECVGVLGPKIPTHSPGKTFRESFFNTGLPSNDLLKSFTSKIGLSFLNFKILKPFFISIYINTYSIIVKSLYFECLTFNIK